MHSIPSSVLGAWRWPVGCAVERVQSGLINDTWVIRDGPRGVAVVQRLNTRIFAPEVHEDIEAVTAHVERAGLLTPRLIPTRQDTLWHTDRASVWRALTWVGDRTVEALADPQDARAAGALVSRFHRATRDLEWSFRAAGRPFHDTPARMQALEMALATHRTHRLFDRVASPAERVLDAPGRWANAADLPGRVVHGDLKISNLRYAGAEAVALIDLDTIGRGTIDAELGDAFRSWCNRTKEDEARSSFDVDLFAVAIEGYAAGGPAALTPEEWDSIVPGIERITLELTARFLTDALEESYFGWNPRQYRTRGDHNLARALGQLALADSVRHNRRLAEAAIRRARRLD